MLSKFPEAIKAYHHSLEINHKSAECHFNLASAYNDVEDHKAAIKHYNKAIDLDDKNADAYFCLAQLYEQKDQS